MLSRLSEWADSVAQSIDNGNTERIPLNDLLELLVKDHRQDPHVHKVLSFFGIKNKYNRTALEELLHSRCWFVVDHYNEMVNHGFRMDVFIGNRPKTPGHDTWLYAMIDARNAQ
jgi:hypothetical protein